MYIYMHILLILNMYIQICAYFNPGVFCYLVDCLLIYRIYILIIYYLCMQINIHLNSLKTDKLTASFCFRIAGNTGPDSSLSHS